MKLTHDVEFAFDLALEPTLAVSFVRDVATSLAAADFLEGLEVRPQPGRDETIVAAALPVNASLFGQQRLPFQSVVTPTPHGARLDGLPLPSARPGWAQVSGEAVVEPTDAAPRAVASRVRYRFEITIHLELPEPERWGGRALVRMIEFTAASVLERVTARFPVAIQSAAHAFVAAQTA